ncbi:hypothetical protein FRC09_000521 [Ceratobasidium sp. 395]|nr:hypothetical protein FRC09_000521 [Ceratobasidium sp. 395]
MILDNISAWISASSGEKLPEYGMKQIDETTVECWIPSTEGTNFEACFDVPPSIRPDFSFGCSLRLDGIDFSGRVIPRLLRTRGRRKVQVKGQSTGPSTMRLFSFGTRVLTDKADHLPPGKCGLQGELNTICLKLQWGHESQLRQQNSFFVPKEHGPIHEKMAKKGHAGSAGLGSVTTTAIGSRLTCNFRPAFELKPLKFIFHYAPQDWLQAREIIPQARPSVKRERDTTPEVIDIEELETDDDEVVIVKHMAPVPLVPVKKRQRLESENDVKPKLES